MPSADNNNRKQYNSTSLDKGTQHELSYVELTNVYSINYNNLKYILG